MVDDNPPLIIVERFDSVALLRFNRPAERNPLSLVTLQELDRLTSALLADEKLQTVIFTGTEDVFASGANIRELQELDQKSAARFSQYGQSLFQRIADAPQVTIAAINGFCMGGALDLALACDIRVAARAAIFAHPGARLGIITGWGGTQRLPRIIGRTRALEFFATAKRFDSEQALKAGLVTRIGDPVIECALDCSREVGSVASLS
jgi:enoyl-CoA hydratase